MDEHLLKYKDYWHFYWDFETCSTNLISPKNHVWELGMIICNGPTIVKEIKRYIRWEPLPITEGAARVTKFHLKEQEYWDTSLPPKTVLDEFDSYLYDDKYIVKGHNVLGFDVYLHKIWRRNLNKSSDWSYLKRIIDTDAIARGHKTGYKYQPGDNFLAYQYRAGSIVKKDCKTNLTALGKEYKIEGVDFDNLHQALEDVKLNRLVWENGLKWTIDI
jgi:hypothetical protein